MLAPVTQFGAENVHRPADTLAQAKRVVGQPFGDHAAPGLKRLADGDGPVRQQLLEIVALEGALAEFGDGLLLSNLERTVAV